MFLWVAVAEHCVMVTMQFLERAQLWSSEQAEGTPDFDPRMIESGRGVLYPLPCGGIVRLHRVDIRRIVTGTWYAPVRALVAILCACAINWVSFVLVGWYPYDFMTRDVFPVPLRRSLQGKDCPGLVPYS